MLQVPEVQERLKTLANFLAKEFGQSRTSEFGGCTLDEHTFFMLKKIYFEADKINH